jgi:hypothetical protein
VCEIKAKYRKGRSQSNRKTMDSKEKMCPLPASPLLGKSKEILILIHPGR